MKLAGGSPTFSHELNVDAFLRQVGLAVGQSKAGSSLQAVLAVDIQQCQAFRLPVWQSANTQCTHVWDCLPGCLHPDGSIVQAACCPHAHIQWAQELEPGNHWSTRCRTMSGLSASNLVKLPAPGQVL